MTAGPDCISDYAILGLGTIASRLSLVNQAKSVTHLCNLVTLNTDNANKREALKALSEISLELEGERRIY